MQIGDIAPGVLRNTEAPNALDFNDVPVREAHDAKGILRHIIRLCFRLARRLGLLFRRSDGENEIGRIWAETRPRSPRMTILAAGLDVAHDQFTIALLGYSGERNPLTVWGNLLPLDPLP